MTVGATGLELFLQFNTPIFINMLTSVLRVSLWILGIGNGLAWCGLAPSKAQFYILSLYSCSGHHKIYLYVS